MSHIVLQCAPLSELYSTRIGLGGWRPSPLFTKRGRESPLSPLNHPFILSSAETRTATHDDMTLMAAGHISARLVRVRGRTARLRSPLQRYRYGPPVR